MKDKKLMIQSSVYPDGWTEANCKKDESFNSWSEYIHKENKKVIGIPVDSDIINTFDSGSTTKASV